MIKKLIFLILFPFAIYSFAPNPITPYPVLGYQEVPFYDAHFKINRQYLIWYPVEETVSGTPSGDFWDIFKVAINAPIAPSNSLRPIVVISHGYTGTPHQLSWLIRDLVFNGFVVLGIQHRDLIDGRAHLNHWQRPQDVTEILNQFSVNAMAKFVDLKKIGIAGYSLGGTTAVWIAGARTTKLTNIIPSKEFAAPEDYVRAGEALATLNKEMLAKDWRDSRIKAAFVMAPAWSWLVEEQSLTKISIPTYFVAAAEDTVLVTKNNAGFFARNIPNAIFQAIPGKADHYIFITALNDAQKRKVNPSSRLNFLFAEDSSIDRRWIQYEVGSEAVRFFETFLSFK